MKVNALILTSGKGSRVLKLSNGLNKALVPVGNKATLSYIVEKFPKGSHIYVTLGYLGDQVRDFCLLAYPDYTFTFIPVPDYEGPGSGPGKSALYAEPYLQEPFYLCLCDCIVKESIDFEDQSNWIGVYPTDKPEIYSTALTCSGQVLDFKNKDKSGYPDAFIGLAHIQTPKIFWKELKDRMVSGELVEVFKGYKALQLKARHFTWYDTGNPKSLQETRNTLCIQKNTGENLYREGNRCIKYFPNLEKVQDLYVRGKLLGSQVPNNLEARGNFIAYDWIEGENLYKVNNYQRALDTLFYVYKTTKISSTIPSTFSLNFYRDKTLNRVYAFTDLYGKEYLDYCFNINGHFYQPLENLLKLVDWQEVCNKVRPFLGFHGDFQPSNLIDSGNDIFYIDWRDSFGGFLGGGDLYYELGKFLGGLEVNYDLVKDDRVLEFEENGDRIKFKVLEANPYIFDFQNEISSRELDILHIYLIRCLVQLSMCPLHTEMLGKYLWFKTIQNLELWARSVGKL